MTSQRKRALVGVTVLVAVGSVIAGWFLLMRQQQKVSTKFPPLTLCTVSFPGYSAFYIARDQGYFAAEGLEVTLKNYDTLSDLTRDYKAGRLEGCANTTFDAVQLAYDGFALKIAAVIDYSHGADGILAHKEIRSPNDLKGKRVAVELGTLEEYFLASALSQFALTLEDVVPVNAGPEEAVQMLLRSEVDAAVTYEPFLSGGLSDTNMHTIFSTVDVPGLISDVLTFRADLVAQNPETVSKVLRAYFKARTFLEQHPEASYAIIAKELKTTPEDAKVQLAGVRILTLSENLEALSPGYLSTSFYRLLDNTSQFLRRDAKMGENLNTDTLVDPTYLRSLPSL